MKKFTLMAASLAFLLTACGGDKPADAPSANTATTSTSTPAPVTNPQAKTVNVHASINPPFVTKDDSGVLTGFDVEIIQAIAELEGLNVNLIPGSWNEALETLDSNKSDIVISAVTLNPERGEKYLASKTYVSTPNAVVVLNDSPIKTLDDLKDKVLGIEKGSSIGKEQEKYPTTEFREFQTSYTALTAAARKQIDAAAGQKLHMQYLLTNNPDIQMRFVDLPSAYPDKVIMVKKGNTELVEKINSGLDKIKANGKYDTIYQKWFGTKPQ